MKLAIIMATFYRKDGRSSSFLTRALNSIANQTYQDYKIFLTGDRYENNEEFETICKSFPYPEKLFYQNLEVAKERDIFNNKVDIWKFGGVNAINHSINISSNEGFNYIVKLDHDDFWENNHLELINECIELNNPAFICTKSKYRDTILPNISSHEKYINFKPYPETLVHSSICFDLNQLPLRYRALGDEKCGDNSGDGCLYFEIRELIEENNLKSVLINKITCTVEGDGYFKNN